MDDRETLTRLHDEENRQEFAILNAERSMGRQAREMERELKDLENAEARTERDIEEEWRHEHWGHPPERPPAWRNGKR